MKALQTTAASCTLLIASIAAHILAGGGWISLHSTAALALIAGLISIFLQKSRHTSFSYIAAIFIAQNVGHFISGGASHNDLQMFAAHLLSGLASYRILRFFNNHLTSLGEIFLSFLSPSITLITIEKKIKGEILTFNYFFSQFNLLFPTFALRAPPRP